MLELVANNSEEDLKGEQIRKQPYRAKCPLCGHRWQTTVGRISDFPVCVRCNARYDFRENT